MKTTISFLCAVAGVAALVETRAATGDGLIVHEWGTFTSVSGSNGVLLSGLEREEHALPPFVYSHSGFAPLNKGWDRPVSGVTVKMETPVIYFYTRKPMGVSVDVKFRGGSISQWYPQRVSGETLPPAPANFAASGRRAAASIPPVDFAKGYVGSAHWEIDVLALSATEPINTRAAWETPQWPRARVPGASKVRGPKGEVEGFIFYRGMGDFALPLRVTARVGGGLVLRNTGVDRIPFVLIYDCRSSLGSDGTAIAWHGPLAVGETCGVETFRGSTTAGATPDSRNLLATALTEAGLTSDEATALLSTWKESYFERPGLRVFWIVPRAFTDGVLPLSISPRPQELVRVLVGRTEVLTPEFEGQLLREFAADGGKRWETDRYALAYRERVRQLRVVLTASHP